MRNNRGRQDSPADKEFTEQVIAIDRVARVVKGGRRFRFRALVVVGDKKTRVGIGISKGADVQTAITKAVNVAKKNMATVVIENATIPHEVEAKVSGAHVLLKPASKGTGIIAGGTVRSVIDVIGVENVLSKSLGSSNKINVAYATLEALKQAVAKKDWITTLEAKPAKTKSDAASPEKETTEKKAPAKKAATKKPAAKKDAK